MRQVLVALLAAPAISLAQDSRDPLFNLVTLSAQAEREVANDALLATLVAEAEGAEPGPLADAVNRAMRRALDLARGYPPVRARSGAYQTFPVHDKGRIARWRVRQELKLESADFAAATDLIGKLQPSLSLAQLSLGVSGETRRQAENALLGEAIAAFEERARLVQGALRAAGYRVRDLHVSGGGPLPPRPLVAARALAAEAAPPAIEPGATRVVISVSGTIQLR